MEVNLEQHIITYFLVLHGNKLKCLCKYVYSIYISQVGISTDQEGFQ